MINRLAKRLELKPTVRTWKNCGCCISSSCCLFFSIAYHNFARYLFITLAFAGLLSTGWFGIPLIPQYLISNEVDMLAGIFTLFSSLGTIWGVMAYREFTKAVETVIEARMAARKLDPMIGDYEYKSYNPITNPGTCLDGQGQVLAYTLKPEGWK
jgi:hypothetical protein